MSNSDSFIDEVTDEIRRERLFTTFRRWGWVAALVVVLVVAAAAWNEWRKARETAQARAFGDAIAEALDASDPAARAAALDELDTEGAAAALSRLLIAAEGAEGEARDRAIEALETVAATGDLTPRYRHLAEIKLVMLAAEEIEPGTRVERLEPLAMPGAPYRLLALEQLALARVAAGEDTAALEILRDLLDEDGVGQGLRQRASQLIVALGGEIEPA